MSGDLGITHRAKTDAAGAIGRERGARDRYMDRGLPSVAVIANVPQHWGSRWPPSSGLERLEERREGISLEAFAETVPIHFDVA